MRTLLLALALLFTSLQASAQTPAPTIAWTNGTPAAGQVAPDGTALYCTRAKPYTTPTLQAPLAQTSASPTLVADVVPVSYTCIARHYRVVPAGMPMPSPLLVGCNATTRVCESADSNEVALTMPAVPLPVPQNLRVTVTMTQNPDGTMTVTTVAEPVTGLVQR